MKKIKWNEGWTFWNDRTPEKRETVWLPHDAMLTEERRKNVKNGVTMGFYTGGKYHYTKTLPGLPEYTEGTVMLEFEGIYMKSTVLLNGERVGGHIYGYTDFLVDLTGKLVAGQENRIEVIADNTQTPNSRWYSGSGIYRDVWLLTGKKEYIVPNGIKLTTTSLEPAVVRAEAMLSPASAGCTVTFAFFRDGEETAAGRAVAETDGTACCEITICDAALWSADDPQLYEVKVFLEREGELLDTAETRTGIRLLRWSAEEGMTVNGIPVKLRGGCIHHDHGPLGAVSLKKAELRRARILKENGYNALRYAHNPAGAAFLDACDETGMYVMVEAFDQWKGKQSDYDYGLYFEQEWEKDLTSMIRMAVNHPCVILYSYGNEISDVGQPEGAVLSKMLYEKCHELDASRPALNAVNPVVAAMGSISRSKTSPKDVVDPYEEVAGSQAAGSLLANMIVTVAPFMSKVMGKPKKVEKTLKGCFPYMDVVGYNYAEQCYRPHHEWNPNRVMVGSETYPPALAKNWNMIENMPYVIGDFQWTAWDYLGEAGIGAPIYGSKRGGFNRPYPCVAAGCGSVDMTGHPETPARYSAIIWQQTKKPYLAVRPVNHSGEKFFFGTWRGTDAVESWSWTGMEGRTAEIEAYGMGAEIEVFQDGSSLGRKPLNDYRAYYQTAYHPGTLRAVTYDAVGTVIGETAIKSAGADLRLTALPEEETIRGDGEDLLYIPVEVTDDAGIRKMLADVRVSVTVEGAGVLAGIGSGNPYTTDSFLGNEYDTYQDRMLCIVRSSGEKGKIRVTIEAEGLKTIVIESEAV